MDFPTLSALKRKSATTWKHFHPKYFWCPKLFLRLSGKYLPAPHQSEVSCEWGEWGQTGTKRREPDPGSHLSRVIKWDVLWHGTQQEHTHGIFMLASDKIWNMIHSSRVLIYFGFFIWVIDRLTRFSTEFSAFQLSSLNYHLCSAASALAASAARPQRGVLASEAGVRKHGHLQFKSSY